MNIYKLYIKGIDEVWRLADFGNDNPAMNYQSNNLAELKDRQSNYSQNLKLPFTKQNCMIFGYSNNLDVNSLVPYRKLECRLFADEILISGKSSYLTLLKSVENFEVQILSGTADFFTSIQNKSMSELDLGTYEVGSKTMLNNYSDNDYCIPMFKASDTFSFSHAGIPFLYILNALSKICESYGYFFEHNITDIEKYACNICSLSPDEHSMDDFRVLANGYLNTSNGWYYYNVPQNKHNLLFYGGVNQSTQKLTYNCEFNCSINIHNIFTALNYNIHFDYKITLNGETIYYDDVNSLLNGNYKEYNNKIDLSKGDILIISVGTYSIIYGSTAQLNSFFEINSLTVTEVPTGGNVSISQNSGFDKQFDFFKAIVQAFGLFVDVNNDSKTVFAYTFKKVIENKVNAFDWSKKLHRSTPDISFQNSSYARKNYLKQKELSQNDTTYTDKGVFIIDNENLENEKDLFELAFESTLKEVAISTNVKVAEIIMFSTDENNVETYSGANPHLTKINLANITNPAIGIKRVSNVVTSENLLDTYYFDLICSLQKYKLIECEFYLTPEDVQKYNPFIPVWIDYFGSYFYVNKIKNFISGKLTKVELIKI